MCDLPLCSETLACSPSLLLEERLTLAFFFDESSMKLSEKAPSSSGDKNDTARVNIRHSRKLSV